LDLLKKHNTPKIIDYLSIDTEGNEFEILKNFAFDKYIFLTITLEHNYSSVTGWREQDKNKRDSINKLLRSQDYYLQHRLINDDCYVYDP